MLKALWVCSCLILLALLGGQLYGTYVHANPTTCSYTGTVHSPTATGFDLVVGVGESVRIIRVTAPNRLRTGDVVTVGYPQALTTASVSVVRYTDTDCPLNARLTNPKVCQ